MMKSISPRQCAIAVSLSSVLVLSGCSTTTVSANSMPLSGDVTTDLKADVQVGEPISGEVNIQTLFGFIKFNSPNKFADGVTYGTATGVAGFFSHFQGGLVARAKSAAAYDAMKSSGADVIVMPQYRIEKSGLSLFYSELNVRVKGLKGTVTSVE